MRDQIMAIWEAPCVTLNNCVDDRYLNSNGLINNDDAQDVANWMHGRIFSAHEMGRMADSCEVDIAMPFLYAKVDCAAYVLGVYLLIIEDYISNGYDADFPIIHYTHFAKSSEFVEIFEKLSFAQKWTAYVITRKFVSYLESQNNGSFHEMCAEITANLEQCCEW